MPLVRVKSRQGNGMFNSQTQGQNAGFNPKKAVAIDTETTGIDLWGPRRLATIIDNERYVSWVEDAVFMVGMCDEEGNTWCCEWDVDPYTREVMPDPRDVAFILYILQRPNIQAIFHNSKFDVRGLSNIGKMVKIDLAAQLDRIHKRGGLHDTLFMARVCFTLEPTYELKPLASKYLGIDNADERDLQNAVTISRRRVLSYNIRAIKDGKERKVKPRLMLKNEGDGKGIAKADYWMPMFFAKQDGKENFACAKYCRLDCIRTMGLYICYKDVMDGDPALAEKYRLEMQDVWPIVNYMEQRGHRVYPDQVKIEAQRCREAKAKHLANMLKMIEEHNLKPFPPEKLVAPLGKNGKPLKWSPPEFNPASSEQLLRILYLPKGKGGLGLEPHFARKGKNKGKSLTADKDTLKELLYEPFVQEIVGFRAADHTDGLFFSKIDEMIKPDLLAPGCYIIRMTLNQCSTKTARFSGGGEGGFNGQQASAGSKKSLGGGSYSSQKVFGPRPGYYLLGFDYSQQEARLFAYLAQVPVMLEAIREDRDIFKAMAEKAWGGAGNPKSFKAGIQALELFKDKPSNCPKCEGHGEKEDGICKACKGSGSMVGLYWKEIGWTPTNRRGVSPDDRIIADIVEHWLARNHYSIVDAEASVGKEASRQRCKHITYAKIFGGGPGSYTHLLLCTLEEAKAFDKEYNAEYPELKKYMFELSKQAKMDGFIRNLYGRKLRVDPGFAYRAVSYMIQGSAADMMKSSLVKVHDFNQRTTIDAHLWTTIHDELKVEIAIRDFERHGKGYMRGVMARMMDTEGRVGVPMPVECTLTKHMWSVEEEKQEVW